MVESTRRRRRRRRATAMTTDLQLRLALISLRMIVFILFQVTILPQTVATILNHLNQTKCATTRVWKGAKKSGDKKRI
jgi:hypothetical protein